MSQQAFVLIGSACCQAMGVFLGFWFSGVIFRWLTSSNKES